MGKVASPARRRKTSAPREPRKGERQRLASRLSKLEQQMAELDIAARAKHLSAEEFDRWLEELTSGPDAPALPADWSRADLYDDHD